MGLRATRGLDELMLDFAALAELPESVIDDMLTAQADVVEPAQKKYAKEMGIYDLGVTEGSIRRTPITSSRSGRKLSIYPQGTNPKGRRNAEVAFMNEFGTNDKRNINGKNRGKMPARPFIRTANEAVADEAVERSARIYNAFVDSKNL